MAASQGGPRASARRRLGVFAAALSLVGALLLAPTTGAQTATAAGPGEAAAVAVAPTGVQSAIAPVPAADLTLFRPGRIIDDAVFFNKGTMTEAQIQSFLQARVPACQSGYTCLKDWYDTSRTTAADAMCGAYQGGTRERASRIIHKVAQACGINPQVILATLQKEQGLVTHTWPSEFRYTIAMGQGCPDTAACDTRYYGFFNQVYGAAWQLKRYANPPGTSQYFTWYAPGKTWNVRYHPNVSCGSSPVRIENQATANLYYYTPYQPNAASIRAGSGTGDSCSSYGNRNFYRYFVDWFGSTTYAVTGAMNTEWQRRGGATGQLGQPVSASVFVAANGGGYVQRFAKGTIWRPNAGGGTTAYSIGAGPFHDRYLAAGAQSGGWGWPQENPRCGLAASGCGMKTTTGTVYYSAATSSHLVLKELDAFYVKAGGPSSKYGYPSAGLQRGPDASYEQRFQKGFFVYHRTNGVVSLSDPVVATWKKQGGLNGKFAWATSAKAVTANGGGTQYEFKNGTFYESAAGVFSLGAGTFRTAYAKGSGPAGAWGWPVGWASCGLTGGGCTMPTQKGTVVYSPATGMVLVSSAIAKAWLANRGPDWLGYPTAAPKRLADGTTQAFQKGTFYQSSAGAVGMTNGGLGAAYAAVGGPTGPAGWPTGPAKCGQLNGGCLMPTQHGTIAFSYATAAVLVPNAAAKAWLSNRGPNWLGYPVSASKSVNGGLVQNMERGVLYTYQGVGVGLANGPLGKGYIVLGAQAGAAGWPTAPARCGLVGGGCVMSVVNGAIAYSPAKGLYLIPTVLSGEWLERGGPDGALGYPIEASKKSGAVVTQRFQGGTLRHDPATGAVTG